MSEIIRITFENGAYIDVEAATLTTALANR